MHCCVPSYVVFNKKKSDYTPPDPLKDEPNTVNPRSNYHLGQLLANLDYLDPIGKSDHVVLNVEVQMYFKRRRRITSTCKVIMNYELVIRDLFNTDWSTILVEPSVEDNWIRFKKQLSCVVTKHAVSVVTKLYLRAQSA